MIERFQQWADRREQYVKEWKERTGGKVIGYFCTYAPEEILYAANILPVRILPSEAAPSIVEPHIFGMYCPVCRGCLAGGLRGEYGYLDGILIAQSCIHMRQAFWSWQKHIPHEYDYYIDMPDSVQTIGRYEYFARELVKFKESVEKWAGKTISNADLDRAIDVYNTNRRLMREVWDFRKRDAPPITGLEALEIGISCQLVDKAEHNQALQELLGQLPRRKLSRETGVRLAIIGSENDDREFAKLTEQQLSLPATLVIEEHCLGTRYFWNEVIPEDDRIMAIGRRYLDRPPCPCKDWPQRLRFPHVLNLIRDYRVEGVLLIQQKYCDPHEEDIPSLNKLLKSNNIPTYFLEFDTTIPLGQFRTRLEAFLETMVEFV